MDESMLMYEPLQDEPEFNQFEVDPNMLDYLDKDGLPVSIHSLETKEDYLAFYQRYSEFDDEEFLEICAEMDIYLKQNKISTDNNDKVFDPSHNVSVQHSSIQAHHSE